MEVTSLIIVLDYSTSSVSITDMSNQNNSCITESKEGFLYNSCPWTNLTKMTFPFLLFLPPFLFCSSGENPANGRELHERGTLIKMLSLQSRQVEKRQIVLDVEWGERTTNQNPRFSKDKHRKLLGRVKAWVVCMKVCVSLCISMCVCVCAGVRTRAG